MKKLLLAALLTLGCLNIVACATPVPLVQVAEIPAIAATETAVAVRCSAIEAHLEAAEEESRTLLFDAASTLPELDRALAALGVLRRAYDAFVAPRSSAATRHVVAELRRSTDAACSGLRSRLERLARAAPPLNPVKTI
jgi:hypothetical protein